VKKLPDGTYR